jgi:hypothetical protein
MNTAFPTAVPHDDRRAFTPRARRAFNEVYALRTKSGDTAAQASRAARRVALDVLAAEASRAFDVVA